MKSAMQKPPLFLSLETDLGEGLGVKAILEGAT
jgi:hypothetical protein